MTAKARTATTLQADKESHQKRASLAIPAAFDLPIKMPGVVKLRRRAERYEKQRHALLPDFTPDALKDGKKLRVKRAERLFGDGNGLACRLWAAADARLVLVTVPLGSATLADLYSHKMNKYARKVSRPVFGRWAAWVKLELGLDGGLHLHILGAADALLLLPKGSNVKHLTPGSADFRRVLAYLCKPSDPRACLIKLGSQRYSEKADPTLLAAAIADYQLARAAGRLPRLSWSHNLPRLKPDVAHQWGLRVSNAQTSQQHSPARVLESACRSPKPLMP